MPDVIVIGAGAAGLMCAIEAGKRGRSVLVLEREDKIGKKIRISGGGRCNFTNRDSNAKNFLSENLHFCKSALAQYSPQDFIALVESHGIAYHEKKLGQLFCDKTSEEIIRMLEEECRCAKVEIKTSCEVKHLAKNGERFTFVTNKGEFESESLVIATGGLSIPQMGATDFGYKIAKQFGLGVVACRPALVPFLWNPHDLKAYVELSGVSVDAKVRCNDHEFRENILFTHRGLSGPAILQISSYWKNDGIIFIDLLPESDAMDSLVAGCNKGSDLVTVLSKFLPKRVVQKWVAENVPAKTFSHCTGKDLKAIADKLHRWKITPAGTEGYGKAEVTVGGVNTDEFSSKTMECKKVQGLFFIGEALDVTGHLGGHNFQWAWSSGFAAGRAA